MSEVVDKNWGRSVRLANTSIELLVPLSFGPRIIHASCLGEKNLLGEFPEQYQKMDPSRWQSFGGHRLWHGPEDWTRTYEPDGAPIQVVELGDTTRFVQLPESQTQMQKELDVYLPPEEPQVQVTHRLYNRNVWDVTLCAWAITVMAPGGKAILPLPPRGLHEDNLTSQTTLTLWAYTDLSDPRYTWGKQFILLQQDPAATTPQKIGLNRSGGWMAYVNQGQAFIKTSAFVENATYPDQGSSVELYTDPNILEMETMGPMVTIPAGGMTELQETWYLAKQVPDPVDEQAVLHKVLPACGHLPFLPG
ncbi:MAG: hypothetical protein GYA17_10695 [Chloroflexi bacterium]|nr:hypothetical protein [Chloroflexota bacterium]